jgi:hypothetical protein
MGQASLADSVQNIKAAAIGQTQISEHNVEVGAGVQNGQCLLDAGRHRQGKLGNAARQLATGKLKIKRVIFDKQNLHG